jgi:anti-sigma factor RsiW
MMRCTRVEKFLPLHVAGDLTGRRARRVISHLATCESCRALACEYDASRSLLRDAATLPPDFDGAFYEELRRSVLDEIKRGRTGITAPAAPAAFAAFASLFSARFAYAASLVLLIGTVAALSLHSYVGRTSEDASQRDERHRLAKVNREPVATPTALPVATQATAGGERRAAERFKESAQETTRGGPYGGAKAPSLQRHANTGKAQTGEQPSANSTPLAPSYAKRNPLATVAVANGGSATENAGEIAQESMRGGDGTTPAPEVSRIEIQTSDPKIRIIWLSPGPDAVQPLK